MNDDRDEILDELRALIAVEVTPTFEASVRREVQARTRSMPGLWWVGAAAVVGALVFVAFAPAHPVTDLNPSAPSSALVAAPTAPPIAAPEQTGATEPAAVRFRAVKPSLVRRMTEPDVIVPPGSAKAFASLVSAARRGEIPNSVWRIEASDVPDAIALDPIEIPPSEIPVAVQVTGIEGS